MKIINYIQQLKNFPDDGKQIIGQMEYIQIVVKSYNSIPGIKRKSFRLYV